MRVRLKWQDTNYGESEQRIYRDTAPLDTQALPAPLATVGTSVTAYDDDTAVDQTTYYYMVGAVYQGAEYFSDPLEVFADASQAVRPGIWITSYAGWGGGEQQRWDPSATGEPTYQENFGLTASLVADNYLYQASGPVDTGAQTGYIDGLVLPATFYITARNGTYYATRCDIDIEFRNSAGQVRAAVRLERDGNFQHGFWYGPDLTDLTKGPQEGSNPRTEGQLRISETGLTYTHNSDSGLPGYNDDWQLTADLSDVTEINIPYMRAYMDYAGGSGSYTYSIFTLLEPE